MITPIPHQQFLSGSIGRVELLAFAALLGWPPISFHGWGPTTIATGEWAWRSQPFEQAAHRRNAYRELIRIDHQQKEKTT